MKKFLLPIAVMLLCMAACQKDNDILLLDVEQYTTDTKLHLDDAHYAVWDNGDAIWFQSSSNVYGSTKTVTIQNNKASISGVTGNAPFTAIYPTGINTWNPIYSNSTYTITYPNTQYYHNNNSGQQVVDAPMAARSTNDNILKFYNLGSILAVNVTNNMGAEMFVHRIEVTAADDVKLGGTYPIIFSDGERPTLGTPTNQNFSTIYLDCNQYTNNIGVSIATYATKTFYIALPPVNARLTIKVYHDASSVHHDQSQASSHQLLANHGYNVPFAIGVPSNEIWYVTSDGQPVNGFWGLSTEGISVSSNTYSDGLGIIHLSGNVTSLPKQCFAGSNCETLTKIILPASVKNIGNDAFTACANLVSITMPGVEVIGKNAFNGCNSLPSVELPSSASTILDQAFTNCASLHSVEMPNVQTIGGYAFSNCTSLVSVSMPNVVTISEGAFINCTNVVSPSSLVLPNITSIGQDAFSGCAALTSVDLGSGISSIGCHAFKDCGNLSTIKCRATTPPDLDAASIFPPFENINPSAVLHIPQGSLTYYRNDTQWYVFTPFLQTDDHVAADL